jgi:hypothetical protein
MTGSPGIIKEVKKIKLTLNEIPGAKLENVENI